MAIRFITAYLRPLNSAINDGFTPRMVLISVVHDRCYVRVGQSLSSLNMVSGDPFPFGEPHDSRYDSGYALRGRTDEQLLRDMLMMSAFNGLTIPDGSSEPVPSRSRYYIEKWQSFTFNDLKTKEGVVDVITAASSHIQEIVVDAFELDPGVVAAIHRGRIMDACFEECMRISGGLMADLRDRYRDVLKSIRASISGTRKPFGTQHNIDDIARSVGRYRGLVIRGYDHDSFVFSFKRSMSNLKELGRQLAMARSEREENDDSEYDEDALAGLLVDFTPKLTQDTRKRIDEVLDDCDDYRKPAVELCDCGHFESHDEIQDVEGDSWCRRCTEEDAVWVVDDECYMRRNNAYYSEMQSEWYSYDYDEENREDDDDEDEDEDEDSDPSQMMDYSTNVLNYLRADSNIKSSQFGDFLMGVEFEMCSGNQPKSLAVDDVLESLGNDYCITKYDGSLPDDGFEIVTAPRGLAEHIQKFTDFEVDSRWRAWNTNACGLHVHIDSRAFSAMTLGKFLMFINSSGNADFIRKLAGRHPLRDNQAQRYCAADGQETLETPVKAIKGKGTDRYRMVNCANLRSSEAQRLGLSNYSYFDGRYNTIELRIFRASLKKERLLAQIEFAHAAVMFCRNASYRDLTGNAFTKWLKTVDGVYPALAKWYGVSLARNKNTAKPAEASCEDKVTSEGD